MARGRRYTRSGPPQSPGQNDTAGNQDDAAGTEGVLPEPDAAAEGSPDPGRPEQGVSRDETAAFETATGPAAPTTDVTARVDAGNGADDRDAGRTGDEAMREEPRTTDEVAPSPAPGIAASPRASAAETPEASPPRRRGGWLAGFVGGLLGSAVLLAGAGWYAYEYGPLKTSLERFQTAETAARNAEGQVAQLRGDLDGLRGTVERSAPALGTLSERLAATEQAVGALAAASEQRTAEIAAAINQLNARLEGANQQLVARLDGLTNRLNEVELGQPADIVDKRTVNDIAARQGGIEQTQARIEAGLARVEQIVAQGLEAGNQRATAANLALEAVRTQVGQLDTQFRELQALRDQVAANRQASEANRAAIEAETAQLAELRTAFEQRLAQVTERLTQLDAARERGVGLALATDSLEGAMTTGEPFRSSLDLIGQLAQNDSTVAEVASRLEPVADDGVPTFAELARQLGEVERSLKPESEAPPEDWLARTRQNLQGLIDLHPAGSEAVPGMNAVENAKQALLLQDLESALAALRPLAEQGNAAAAAWVEAAQRRLDARAAIEALRVHVKTILTQQG